MGELSIRAKDRAPSPDGRPLDLNVEEHGDQNGDPEDQVIGEGADPDDVETVLQMPARPRRWMRRSCPGPPVRAVPPITAAATP